jgi:hypothetical protein
MHCRSLQAEGATAGCDDFNDPVCIPGALALAARGIANQGAALIRSTIVVTQCTYHKQVVRE